MAKPAAPAFTLMRSNWAQEFLRVNGEELAQWIPKTLQKEDADSPKDLQSFIAYLMTGVPLCELVERCSPSSHWPAGADRPVPDVTCKHNAAAKPGSFHARENVANFIDACRKLGLPEISLFAPDDLIDQKNLKAVVNCLLHLSKIGAQNGINPPDIVQYELDLDAAARNNEEPAEATEILVPEQFELTQEQFEAIQAVFVRVDEAQALAVTRKDLAAALKSDEKVTELRGADSGFDKRFEHLESDDPEPIDLGDFLFWWRHVARRKEHVMSRRASTVDAKELESQKPEARPRLLSHVPGHSRRGSAPISFEDFKYLPHVPDADDALDSMLAEELNHNVLDVRVRRYANPEETGGYWYRFGKANSSRINLRMVRGLLMIRDGHNWDGVVHYIQNRLGTLAEDES